MSQPFLKDELILFSFSLQPAVLLLASITTLREHSILPELGASIEKLFPPVV